jgi:hypothetical protein
MQLQIVPTHIGGVTHGEIPAQQDVANQQATTLQTLTE